MDDKLDIVPSDMSKRDFVEEVNYRTTRAGLTTRSGGAIPLKSAMTVSVGEQKLNVWPRDADGNLID